MLKQLTFVLGTCLIAVTTWAQGVSPDELIGVWEFVSYADTDTPDERRPVGVKMEFKSDGTVVSMMSTGDVESLYRIEGTFIVYSDANGEQIWEVHSFEPGRAIVLNNRGTLMYLEKP